LLDPCYSMFLVESKCNIPNLSNKVVHDFTLIRKASSIAD